MSGLIAVFEDRRAALTRYLVARIGNEADAEDLISDMWIKVSNAVPGPIGNPEGYLYRMASNLALDRVREARRRDMRQQAWTQTQLGHVDAGTEVADPAPTADEMLADGDRIERLAHAIEQLPDGARRVLTLHKLEELSHADVAASLGISKSAVEKHMAVAMKHLRRLLRD